MKINLYIVRHGQTSFNFENKVQGWGDSFLTPEGIEGVKKLGNYWKRTNKTFDKIYSSDSGRTLQTTRIILETIEKDIGSIIPHPGLREYNFGYYEGLEEELLEKEMQEIVGISFLSIIEQPELVIDSLAALDRKKKAGITNTWFSETAKEYTERIVGTIDGIVAQAIKDNSQDILIVSHGMTISMMAALLSNGHKATRRFGVANATCTTITYQDGKYQLVSIGEVKE